MELRAAGVLKRLWRVPGRNATIGLYEAADPAQLHDALMSLPMAPWLDVHVEPLATHPRERSGPAGNCGSPSASTTGRWSAAAGAGAAGAAPIPGSCGSGSTT